MKMKDFNISMTQYNRGDIITGTIVMIGETEVVVALGGLKEGVFPKSELDPAFKIGDAILVMVTGDIDDKGCLILNHEGVNKALSDKEKLKTLKVGSEFSFTVTDITTAGINGEFMGYHVFLPFSQCSTQDYTNRDGFKNKEISAVVLELNSMKKSIVCSSKLLNNTQFEPVAEGERIAGTIIRLEDKYALVQLKNGARAKLSIADVSHNRIETMSEAVKLDEEYEFVVLETNSDFSRISVGLKQLMENPKDKLFNSLNLGDEVEGKVAKILPVGAVIELDNGLSALAITRENSDRANVATHHIYKLNSRVKGYISRIDKERKKINILTNLKTKDQI